MRLLIGVAVFAYGVVSVSTTMAAEPAVPQDPLVKQVEKAIAAGGTYLKQSQTKEAGGKGHWENGLQRKGGFTCLALLALLNAGEDPTSDVIQRGLKYLREDVPPKDTYVVGLQTMVFAAANAEDKKDDALVGRNVKWLLEGRIIDDKKLRGWGYEKNSRVPDNSNTQYALLGLHAGRMARATIARGDWEMIRDFYQKTQRADGGWVYNTAQDTSTFTMSVAGLCGLLISGRELNEDQQQLQPDGTALKCGKYSENDALAKATRLIGKNFNLKVQFSTFYNLYGIERAGRLSGQRFFGEYDWYREGCRYLVNPPGKPGSVRHADGSWYLTGKGFDSWPVVSTSFAVLFMSKGRTPVLISKLAHHLQDVPDLGWNNKHNDVPNLVEFASQNLFNKQPLAWQVFNCRSAGIRRDEDQLAAELLQSPIAYFNGHRLRSGDFTDVEKRMLKKYVEQGGFILAEACCGSKDFDTGFRQLMGEIFDMEEHPLRKLRPEHPIYTAYYPLLADKDRPLYGIEFGCKTLVVYSPHPLAGWWEANQTSKGSGERAFKLGANIIAYATGMELPKPRGTEVEILDKPESSRQRGYFKVAQLQHEGQRTSNLGVLHNLMSHMQKKYGMEVALKTEELGFTSKDLLNYKFVYMHGKKDFDVEAKDLKTLKANLEDGGLLFADACCGSPGFNDGFRRMIKKLFGKELEPIPVEDDLFGKELNSAAITSVKCRREKGEGKAGYRTVAPYLEGIKVGDRWAVIYSKYDIGCALEKHQSTDCLGHDYESAVRLGSAVVLYYYQR
jgi:hypothetical protein